MPGLQRCLLSRLPAAGIVFLAIGLFQTDRTAAAPLKASPAKASAAQASAAKAGPARSLEAPVPAAEPAPAASQPALPTGEEVLRRQVEATGGRKAYDRIKTLVIRCQIPGRWSDLVVEEYWAPPGRYYALARARRRPARRRSAYTSRP